jgi:hypothetical protein
LVGDLVSVLLLAPVRGVSLIVGVIRHLRCILEGSWARREVKWMYCFMWLADRWDQILCVVGLVRNAVYAVAVSKLLCESKRFGQKWKDEESGHK